SHVALQIGALLEYLHDSASVFQLDLKPENLALVGEKQIIKIMDFGSVVGLSRRVDRQWRYGTPGYLAPEMFVDQDLMPACDIFAFGALLLELIIHARPFERIQSSASLDTRKDWFGFPTTAFIQLSEVAKERNEQEAAISKRIRAEMAG